MAHTTTAPRTEAFSGIRSFFERIGEALVSVNAAHWRARELEALMALSDDELAARGLQRDAIVRHVFIRESWM